MACSEVRIELACHLQCDMPREEFFKALRDIGTKEFSGLAYVTPSFFRQKAYQLEVRNKKPRVADVNVGKPDMAQATSLAASGVNIHLVHNSADTSKKRMLSRRPDEDGTDRSADDGLPISKAAARLGCDRSTIYRLVQNGVLWGWTVSANPNIYDGCLRIDPESIEAYKSRYCRGGSFNASSYSGGGSGSGRARPARRRVDASSEKYRQSLLSLESAGITFRGRKA